MNPTSEVKEPKKPGPKPKDSLVVDVSEELENEKIMPGPNRMIGYVHGKKLYKPGYKSKDKSVHVDWKGRLNMPRCPECKHHNSATECVKGVCEKCGHHGHDHLD